MSFRGARRRVGDSASASRRGVDRLEARTRLPAAVSSPRSARRFVESNLRAWGCPHLLDPVALLTSELVTNAVLHAGTPLEVTVRHTGGAVRVEVADESITRPAPRDADEDADTGRGLRLVATLADGWGVDARPDGKAVWLEVHDRARSNGWAADGRERSTGVPA